MSRSDPEFVSAPFPALLFSPLLSSLLLLLCLLLSCVTRRTLYLLAGGGYRLLLGGANMDAVKASSGQSPSAEDKLMKALLFTRDNVFLSSSRSLAPPLGPAPLSQPRRGAATQRTVLSLHTSDFCFFMISSGFMGCLPLQSENIINIK